MSVWQRPFGFPRPGRDLCGLSVARSLHAYTNCHQIRRHLRRKYLRKKILSAKQHQD